MYIESLNSVNNLRTISIPELPVLAKELRDYIIDIVSKNGGHLASSLGVIELTIALHYTYNTPTDRLIWDVGHQSYAHKIITGRREQFDTIRQYKGLSGFPKVSESKFDTYNCGHSSTSLSLAIGEAVARDINNENYKVLAIIGDGSMTGGMSFEALNQIGDLNKDLTIILNDNDHSISKNVGALSEYLTSIISGNLYNSVRKGSSEFVKKIPGIGDKLSKIVDKTESNIKGMLVPGQIFEELGIRYFGPIDGHNIDGLIKLFTRLQTIQGPKIVHIITKKGKGYLPAEGSPSCFHGVGPFEKETGLVECSKKVSYSEVVGNTLVSLANKDDKIVAITAAMISGTGLDVFAEKFSDKIYDVGIAEQHAITFASALAKNKVKPFVAIYSTFLQRAYDQLIHDVGIMNLPIKILIDRAGIVGADGETHHGLFDISFIKNIPNFIFLSPANGIELRDAIYFAANYNDGPIAIRFPRGCTPEESIDFDKNNDFEIGKIKILKEGTDIAIFALGDMVLTALKISEILKEKNISVNVVNILSIKPLDINGIEKVIQNTKHFITIENGYLSGGIGEEINFSIDKQLRDKHLQSFGFEDIFITHGGVNDLFDEHGLTAEKISQKITDKILNKIKQ